MKMKYFLAVAALSFSLTSQKLFAEAPDKKYIQTLSEMLKVTNTEALQDSMIDKICEALTKNAKDPAVAKKSSIAFFKKTVGINALLPEMAEIYHRSFTQADLEDFLKFYKTPLGIKMIKGLPEVMQSSMQLGQEKMKARIKEFETAKQKMDGFI